MDAGRCGGWGGEGVVVAAVVVESVGSWRISAKLLGVLRDPTGWEIKHPGVDL